MCLQIQGNNLFYGQLLPRYQMNKIIFTQRTLYIYKYIHLRGLSREVTNFTTAAAAHVIIIKWRRRLNDYNPRRYAMAVKGACATVVRCRAWPMIIIIYDRVKITPPLSALVVGFIRLPVDRRPYCSYEMLLVEYDGGDVDIESRM